METEKRNKKGTDRMKIPTKIKEKQLKTLEDFNDRLRLLIALQKNAIQRAQLSDEPIAIHLERLSVYDRFVPLIITVYENLDDLVSPKHPGGAPPHKFRNLAWDVLTYHFCGGGGVLNAKELVRAVAEKLPKGSLDPDASGKEPFSIRIARTIIKEFKICLNPDPND